ncbi:RteC domain-containing protein [Mucilaginibacter sp.]|jgi:hypothetical protein|uniref:RteC domain-containing protein n=1 Tax=Mucilaginibacter sp. TaxID=1882438 RepID=UPI0035626A44
MILKFSERLYEDLNSALGALKLEEKRLLKRLEQSVLVCIKFFTRLRDFYKEHEPNSKEDKIRFFKEVKPKFKALLIFHQALLRIEGRRTIGAKEDLSLYYLDEVKVLTHYFEDHTDFYRYVRSEDNYLDEQYYLPGVFNVHLDPDENVVDADTVFCTSHDNKLAHIIAHELLLAYLEKAILRLNSREETDLYTFIEEEMMVWTQTNTALSENIYGWKETKAINHGKTSIARITAYMQRIFHVDIGSISDNWNYICERAGKTIYLDEMKKRVLERMNKKLE